MKENFYHFSFKLYTFDRKIRLFCAGEVLIHRPLPYFQAQIDLFLHDSVFYSTDNHNINSKACTRVVSSLSTDSSNETHFRPITSV